MEQVRMSSESVEATVLPALGARLHRLRVFGHDLLRTPDTVAEHERDPFAWGGYVMAPWCNRIAPDSDAPGGESLALDANFPDGSAIHGQVYGRLWQHLGDGAFAVAAGGDGWPWIYEVTQHTTVIGPSLKVELSLINRSSTPMPAGLGLHPWFALPVLMSVAAESVYPENLSSAAEPLPVTGRHDLRRLGHVPAGLDATWVDVGAAVELAWPDAGIRARMLVDSPSTHIVVAHPVDIDGVAVEPQTHAPQGLRRLLNAEPGAMTLLDPGQTLSLAMTLNFEDASA